MIDYRWFFFILSMIGLISLIAGAAAMFSTKTETHPEIKPAYGSMKWSAPEELEIT